MDRARCAAAGAVVVTWGGEVQECVGACLARADARVLRPVTQARTGSQREAGRRTPDPPARSACWRSTVSSVVSSVLSLLSPVRLALVMTWTSPGHGASV